MNQAHVLVIGAGFAGLSATKALSKNKNLKITLVDRRNHHLFQPLLYQVATAGLSPADISTPIRNIFTKQKNVTVLMDEAVAFLPKEKSVQFTKHKMKYDYLVIACGANHSYFGHGEWEENAPGLKTLEQATELRRRILLAFEEAESSENPAEIDALMTFVIIGGGPTGVELAGAIAELSRNTMARDFRRIDPKNAKILLVEAGPKVLAQFDEKLGLRASSDLTKLGVHVKTNTKVLDVSGLGIKVEDNFIAARTVIWAAGVKPSATGKELSAAASEVKLDPAGRVIVKPDLSIEGEQSIFVIGDQSNVTGENGKPLPGLAPVAMQEGRHAAENIKRLVNSVPTVPFHYLDKGQMATVGRKKAVVQFGKIRFGGFIAWLAWLVIHIYYIIGFKNRLFIFLQWTWSYLTFSRGARLIVSKDWKLKP